MKPTEYEKNVLITESSDMDAIMGRIDPVMVRLLHAGLGLSSELAEIKESLLKGKRESYVDYVNLREECGDLAWYTAVAIHALGQDPEKIWPKWGNEDGNTLFATPDSIEDTFNVLTINVGEFNNLIKRTLFYGKSQPVSLWTESLESIAVALSGLALNCGSYMAAVRATNIGKLKFRYNDKFTEAAALNRDVVTERSILENGS